MPSNPFFLITATVVFSTSIFLSGFEVLAFTTRQEAFSADISRRWPINLTPSGKKAGFHPVESANYNYVPKRRSSLYYREHDASDTGTSLLKLDTRTPPIGYDVKEHIEPQPLRKNGINIPVILALLANQAIVLVGVSGLSLLALFLTDGFSTLTQLPEVFHWAGSDKSLELSVSYPQVLWGVAGALPSIFIGSQFEKSDKRAFANTNFSTILMVMTIFGRRNAPPKEFIPEQYRGITFPTSSTFRVAYWSLALACVTGFCEEFIFRCEIPSLITHYSDNVALALFLQALLFGLGHASPRSNLTENGIVMSLQAVNGFCFGLLYILSGGDIVPCMIAHAIYDFQVFFLTWVSSNDQIEYADRMYLEPFPQDVQKEVSKLRVTDDKLFRTCKRLFYTFDYDKNKTLSLSEVRRGISYLWLELGRSSEAPPEKNVDDLFKSFAKGEGVERMRFPEFAKLFAVLQKQNPIKAATI